MSVWCISGCRICEKPKIKTVHSKKRSTISSNFLDNILYRKMHYPWPKRLCKYSVRLEHERYINYIHVRIDKQFHKSATVWFDKDKNIYCLLLIWIRNSLKYSCTCICHLYLKNIRSLLTIKTFPESIVESSTIVSYFYVQLKSVLCIL